MALAGEIARLADAAERLLVRAERRDREESDAERRLRWGSPLRHVDLACYLSAIPGFAARFDRTVPPEFVAQTAENRFAVACPCGQEPILIPGRLSGCECGRWFLHDGSAIHVALSPVSDSAAPTVEAESEDPHPPKCPFADAG